ncbi:MAG: DNA repair protein RecN [Alphaproteobacteria bacterium]|nr:DNA repair protein RecN [Alphaproteobacteria bacterium]
MLTALSIRDVVLIDRLDLSFEKGLCVLTGETGAGKSILLDSLGLALGARAESGLVRHGVERAVVTAMFEIGPDHPAHALLAEQELDDPGGEMVLRRMLGADGRSRAFINDQPASVGLLRRIGETLVEIQGQFEPRGLIDPATHRALLDRYGVLGGEAAVVRETHKVWRKATQATREAEDTASEAERDREFLEHAVEELAQLDPQPGEEEKLAEQRTRLMHSEQLVEALNAASAELAGSDNVEDSLRVAQRHLARMADKAGGALDAAVAALERAAVETTEAIREIAAAGAEIDPDQGGLETVEERLFTLRAVARKHGVEVDELAALRQRMGEKLALAQDRGGAVERLRLAERKARTDFFEKAAKLTTARKAAAARLDRAVNMELPPLKLEKARFVTAVETQEEAGWTADGIDRVAFLVSTNPGTPEGPLGKVASGGELSRIMLALKVVAAEPGDVPTLIFDEVDANVGGATADAVGERLARLAGGLQVLVVTHSPQVAARGHDHMRVEKGANGGTDTVTRITRLSEDERREEVARMLSGAAITEEARAQAARLIEQAGA